MRRGPVLVLGLGRRHLPEPQPHQRRAPGHRLRVRCRPHLRHGSPPDGRAPHAERCGGDRGRHPRAARPGAGVRGDRGRPRRQDHRLPREGRRPARPCPATTTRVLASMGNYVFNTTTLVDIVTPGPPSSDGQGSRRRRHPGAHGERGGAPVRLLDQRDPRAGGATSAATGATSGRSTPTTGPTWTCWARCRRSACTTRSGRSTASSSRCRRPSSATAATARAASVDNSLICTGSIVSGGRVERSIVGPDVRIETGAR